MKTKMIKSLMLENKLCSFCYNNDDSFRFPHKFIFNPYSYNPKDDQYELAIFKKWSSGIGWNRYYDENWDDVHEDIEEDAETEPEFDNLLWYLSTKNIDYNKLSLTLKDELNAMIMEATYEDDPYYGCVKEYVKYIPLKLLDKWIVENIQ